MSLVKKKVLSAFLVMALCFGLVPTSFAAQTGALPTDEEFLALLPQKPEPIPHIEDPSQLCPYNLLGNEFPFASVYEEIVSVTQRITSGKTLDTSKAKAIYQWVASNISYDYVAFEYIKKKGNNDTILSDTEQERVDQAENAFSTFYNKRGVCGGYANLSQLMLTLVGLPSAYISGYSRNATDENVENKDAEYRHAWNAVYADGKWIFFDATWSKWDISRNYHKKIDNISWRSGIWSGRPQSETVSEWIADEARGEYVKVERKHIVGAEYYIASGLGVESHSSITVPSYVENITFSGFDHLQEIIISDGTKVLQVNLCPLLHTIQGAEKLSELSVTQCNSLSMGTLSNGNTLLKLSIKDCGSLTELAVPNSVTDLMISNCNNLKKVVMGSGITQIKEECFAYCPKLEEVSFGKNLEYIDQYAFSGDLSLKELHFPDSLKEISPMAFYQCTGVTNIVIPDGIRTIEWLPGSVGLTEVSLPQWAIDQGVTPEGIMNGTIKIINGRGVGSLSRPSDNSTNTPYIQNQTDGNKWWSEAVNKMLEYGFVNSSAVYVLDGNHKVSRLEFTQICTNLIEAALNHELSAANLNTFSDTQDIEVRKAYAAGVILGTSSDEFMPDEALTRQQAAIIFYRILEYISKNSHADGEIPLTLGQLDELEDSLPFLDRDDISPWALSGVCAMEQLGIIKGDGDGNFAPQRELSYGETATIVIRLRDFLYDYNLFD